MRDLSSTNSKVTRLDARTAPGNKFTLIARTSSALRKAAEEGDRLFTKAIRDTHNQEEVERLVTLQERQYTLKQQVITPPTDLH